MFSASTEMHTSPAPAPLAVSQGVPGSQALQTFSPFLGSGISLTTLPLEKQLLVWVIEKLREVGGVGISRNPTCLPLRLVLSFLV